MKKIYGVSVMVLTFMVMSMRIADSYSLLATRYLLLATKDHKAFHMGGSWEKVCDYKLLCLVAAFFH